MGTTLTGTTPQDTYDSLIKVTDNGPLSGTLKKLTDGLGNDSSLSLSTTAASLSGTLAVTGNATFDTNTLFVDATNNRVGVGTISPTASLDTISAVSGTYSASTQQVVARIFNSPSALGSGVNSAFLSLQTTPDGEASNPVARIGVVAESYGSNNSSFVVATRDGSGITERMRITSAGNVGIGTSAPAAGYKLDVAGRTKAYNAGYIADFVSTESNASSIQLYADNTNVSIVQGGTSAVPLTFFVSGTEKMRIQTGGGISFNGDTAAANALDDYEEGTWTMGISFGGASVGVTYGVNTGTYTKIGRQVTANGLMTLSSKGSSTGAAFITGLPFTIASGNSNYAAVSLRFDSITFTNQFQAYGGVTSTNIELEEITLLGAVSALTNADFANACSIMVSATYFV